MELEKTETVVKTATIYLTDKETSLLQVILTNALIQLNAGFRKNQLSNFSEEARRFAVTLYDKLY